MTNREYPLRAPNKTSIPVMNIAHRGARGFAPENTLAAFQKAKQFACPMFEMDVHMSKDCELVVHHDDQLQRCTNVQKQFPERKTYFVSDFTYEELLTLDAGSWYVDELNKTPEHRQKFLQSLTSEEIAQYISQEDREYYLSGEVKLPTLAQTLELAKNENMMVNVEIKTMPRMYSGITKRVIELIKEMKMEQSVLISSFDHEQLVIARKLDQHIATGVLTSDRLAKPGDYVRLLDADAYNPGCYDDYDSLGFSSVTGQLDATGIEHVRAQHFGVNVWTCNDTNNMQKLINAGVTGLITDYPNRVQAVLSISR